MTRSQSSIAAEVLDDFIDQGFLDYFGSEQCLFSDNDIDRLRSDGSFPIEWKFRAFSPRLKADLSSPTWVCFNAYPFNLGLSYPFPELINEFFNTTGLSYSQFMPQVWRILYTLCKLNEKHDLTIGVPEIALHYKLRTHGHSRFVLQLRSGKEAFVHRASQDNRNFRSNFFFVNRNTIPGAKSCLKDGLKRVGKQN